MLELAKDRVALARATMMTVRENPTRRREGCKKCTIVSTKC
jgi:hypothetical protein